MQRSAIGKPASGWVQCALAGLMALGLSACGGGGDDPPAKAWQTSWATAPTGPASLSNTELFLPLITLDNQTVRLIVRSNVAGSQIRIRLSNEIGDAPAALEIGAAHVAVRDKGSSIVSGTDRTLTFGGKRDVVIPAKGMVYSDPVDLNVAAMSDLAISLYLPKKTVVQSAHFVTRQNSYLNPGNESAAVALSAAVPTSSWFVATGLDVMSSKPMTLVAYGDSITDGFGDSSMRTDAPTPWPSWPSRLADRVAAASNLAGLSVVNAGISGNRLMSDAPNLGNSDAALRARAVYGPKGVSRFQRDVVEQRGASCVVILQGINDIGIGAMEGKPVTSAQITAAYQQMIAQARGAGMKAIGATLLPFAGYAAPYYSADNNAIRESVNQWIRTSGAYDAVIDFDAIVRDPGNPLQMQAQYDSGDHLHPNDVGYKAMADGIDLSMLQKLCIKS